MNTPTIHPFRVRRRTLAGFLVGIAAGLVSLGALCAAETKSVSTIPLMPAFSAQTTDQEITRARVFGNPLIPVGTTSPAENQALGQSLLMFLQRTNSEDASAINKFLNQYPASAWRAALQLNLGLGYYHTAQYSKCLAAWEDAWNLAKDAKEPRAHMMADMALGQLSQIYARLGRADELQQLLNEARGRPIRGSATELVAGSREGLWSMHNRPEISFRCGPLALSCIRTAQKIHGPEDELIPNSKSTTNGVSLTQVCELSKALKMNYQMAFRSPGAKLILPAVIHWKLGHYAALINEVNGRYLAEDPTFVTSVWFGLNTLEEESDGYFLVPPGDLPAGWRAVGEAEGQTIWGKGTPPLHPPDYITPCDKKAKCSCSCPGMADYNIHLFEVSLNIEDTPLRYTTSFGPPVQFTVTYNQRESFQPIDPIPFSNLGQKWTFNWLGYIEDDPQSGGGIFSPAIKSLSAADTTKSVAQNAGGGAIYNPPKAPPDVIYYIEGGGMEVFTFDTQSSTFAVQTRDRSVLVRTSANSYELRLPDGSKKIFGRPDGISDGRRVFLTRIVNPYGDAVDLAYDEDLRLTTITDAAGRQTHLSYELPGDSYKITRVEDPFGRSAAFQYNSEGQLTNITDMIGIQSSFTYDGDFINSLTTPYGTTTFTFTDQGDNQGEIRSLEATDPMGQKERVEYNQQPNITGLPFSVSDAPQNIWIWNNYMFGRNTFYWDKKAMAEAPGNYSKARITHWMHSADWNSAVGVVESEKAPLESRIWYEYPGEAQKGYPNIDLAVPCKTARVMDDGSTQLSQSQRNAIGNVTQYIDPSGRTTIYNYDTNLIDLLQVQQVVGTSTDLLGSFTYSTNHLLLSSVNAAGQTNYYGYNQRDQLIAATNALNETTTISYDANGLLTNIVGAIPGATTSFNYDANNRLQTETDSEGYSVTYSYDGLDRITNIAYPDGTFKQVAYNLLDQVLVKDRRGHWKSMAYDQLRRLTDAYDSIGRHTHYGWCGCGSLDSITDPAGNTTTWIRDIQGRATAIIYPDLTQTTYTYEANTSRLKMFTDAKNQSTIYDYFNDNNLAQVTYLNAVIATPSVSFAYDTSYNRPVSMIDGIGTTTYSYYPVTSGQLGSGRLQSVDGPLDNDTITYSYDELGRIIIRTINDMAEQVTYDALGRVTMVTNALGGFTNVYVRATGLIATNFYPNGQQTVFSYYGTNNDLRLEQIQNLSPNGQNISTFSYNYDADGQITNWTEQADAQTPTVKVPEYDPVDQLLGVTVHGNNAAGTILKQFLYSYDPAGNRTSEQIDSSFSQADYNNLNQNTNRSGSGTMRFKGHLNKQAVVTVNGNPATVDHQTTNFVGYANVNPGTNTISIVAADYSGYSSTNRYQIVVTNNGVTETITYDLNGNETSVITATSTNTYQWDAANRMVGITQLSANNTQLISQFVYDGFGHRTRIIELQNGIAVSTNIFLWDGLTLAEQRDNTGANVVKRFMGEGEQILGVNYYFTYDHLGSAKEMTDSAGAIRARYDYDPYGRTMKLQGDLESDFGFTGYYIHRPSELYMALYRTYDSDLGRWPSRDPIGENGGLNLYNYVGNDPLNSIDPEGLYYLVPNDDEKAQQTIYVEKCEIVIYIGHGSKQPHKWIMSKNCSAGGFLGCYAEQNNAGIPNALNAGLKGPPYDDVIKPIDSAYKEGLQKLHEAAITQANAMLKGCCKSVKIITINRVSGVTSTDNVP